MSIPADAEDDDFCIIDWLLAVNSDPDVDPDEDDDTIGHPCDEMSHWDLGEPTLEDGGDEEEECPSLSEFSDEVTKYLMWYGQRQEALYAQLLTAGTIVNYVNRTPAVLRPTDDDDAVDEEEWPF